MGGFKDEFDDLEEDQDLDGEGGDDEFTFDEDGEKSTGKKR